MDDGLQYYLFVPVRATLYGRDEYANRFVKVIEYKGNTVRYTTTKVMRDTSSPNASVYVDVVDASTFIQYMTFGYTPYIEALFSGFEGNGFEVDTLSDFVLTQAALRNYDARCRQMMSMLNRKRASISGHSMNNALTGELVDELRGTLACWEMLMNMGRLSPKNILVASPINIKGSKIPYKEFEEKHNELAARMLSGNHKALKYKLDDSARSALLKAYGF